MLVKKSIKIEIVKKIRVVLTKQILRHIISTIEKKRSDTDNI